MCSWFPVRALNLTGLNQKHPFWFECDVLILAFIDVFYNNMAKEIDF